MARLGIPLTPETVRQAHPHDRQHKQGVLAAIQLGPSNGRLEALNSKVRLISHGAYGFHSADALIAMIRLCCAEIQIALSKRREEPAR